MSSPAIRLVTTWHDPTGSRLCPGCGGDYDGRQLFCGWCGRKLRNEPDDSQALEGWEAGERKYVTVLFADIVGSTAMISGLDPEQAASLLDPMLSKMATIVGQQAGFVARLTGDGIKAIFGVPVAREDHAERACAAALAIRAAAREHQLHTRIGLHSGEVMVRGLQTGTPGDYDAVGMVVHLAARLEQIARPGSIYLSAGTAQLVKGRFNLRPAGSRVAKGVRGAIELFELLRYNSGRTRWSARAHKGLSHFVGRTEELATLLNAVRVRGQVVSVLGEAGAGKSRLIFEVLRRREFLHCIVMKAEVEADDDRAGLRPFARMLRSWLHVRRNDTPALISAKLDERLGQLRKLNRSETFALRVLLDLPNEAKSSPVQQSEIINALRQLVARCCAMTRTLLIVEDTHWLDEQGQRLLRFLGTDAAHTGLTVVQSSRLAASSAPELGPSIVLTRLSAAESWTLLDAILGADLALAELKTQIIARADGIPLFLEEMARYLRFSSDVTEPRSTIPDSIQGIIGERIDRLPISCRELLRVASAVGREVPVQLLRDLQEYREPELKQKLRVLEQSGFVRIDMAGEEEILVFSHELTREVAYEGMLKGRRRAIHGAVVTAYESAYEARLDEHVETLGAHASKACEWRKAEHYLRLAAKKAIDRSSHANAIQFIHEALQALGQFDLDISVKAEYELELRLLLRVAFNAIGNYRERLSNLDRAEVLTKLLDRRSSLPALWVSRASVTLQLGDVDSAIRLCAKARRIASREGDHETGVIAGYMLSRSSFYNGRLAASLATAKTALTLLRQQPGSQRHGGGFGSSEVMLLTQLAQTSACLGMLSEAHKSAREALSIAERLGRSFDIALASYGFGVAWLYSDKPESAVRELERGMRASASEGRQSIYAPLGGLLAYSLYRAGGVEDALSLSEKMLSYPEVSLYHGNWPRLFASMIRHGTGDGDRAMRLAQAARTVAKKGGYPLQLVWSDLLLARQHCRTSPAIASRYIHRAREQSRLMRIKPCLAWALIESGHVQNALGREQEAREFLRKGHRLGYEIGLQSVR